MRNTSKLALFFQIPFAPYASRNAQYEQIGFVFSTTQQIKITNSHE